MPESAAALLAKVSQMSKHSGSNSIARFRGHCSMYIGLVRDRNKVVENCKLELKEARELVEVYEQRIEVYIDTDREQSHLRDTAIAHFNSLAKPFEDCFRESVKDACRYLTKQEKILAYEWVEQTEEIRLARWPELNALLKALAGEQLCATNEAIAKRPGRPGGAKRSTAWVRAIEMAIKMKDSKPKGKRKEKENESELFKEIDVQLIDKKAMRIDPIEKDGKIVKAGVLWDRGDTSRSWNTSKGFGDLIHLKDGKWKYIGVDDNGICNSSEN